MDTRYIFFHTARAAVFQFYAFIVLLLLPISIKYYPDIPLATVVSGTILYVLVVVSYAFHIDRTGRGKRGE